MQRQVRPRKFLNRTGFYENVKSFQDLRKVLVWSSSSIEGKIKHL